MSMTLLETIERLDSFDPDHTIFIDRKCELSGSTPAIVAEIDEDDNVPDEAAGYSEFLDIWYVIEIVNGKCALAGLKNPTTQDKLRLLLEYAENDA